MFHVGKFFTSGSCWPRRVSNSRCSLWPDFLSDALSTRPIKKRNFAKKFWLYQPLSIESDLRSRWTMRLLMISKSIIKRKRLYRQFSGWILSDALTPDAWTNTDIHCHRFLDIERPKIDFWRKDIWRLNDLGPLTPETIYALDSWRQESSTPIFHVHVTYILLIDKVTWLGI